MSVEFKMSRRGALKCVVAGGVIAAFGGRSAQAATTLEKARASGILTVGISNERPYAFLDSDGTLKGAIPEVLEAALNGQGIKELKAQIVDFNALIPGLSASRFDIIGAGMYIRPARCMSVAFSNPITQAGGALLARSGNTIKASSLEELTALPDLMIGTQSGSTQVEELTKAGLPRDRLVLFAREDEAVSGLQAERCDAIYFPALQVNEVLKKFPDAGLVRIANFATNLNYQAFGLRKDDEDLRVAINEGIAKIIGNGELLKIIGQYGYGKDEIPDIAVTAAKLCAE